MIGVLLSRHEIGTLELDLGHRAVFLKAPEGPTTTHPVRDGGRGGGEVVPGQPKKNWVQCKTFFWPTAGLKRDRGQRKPEETPPPPLHEEGGVGSSVGGGRLNATCPLRGEWGGIGDRKKTPDTRVTGMSDRAGYLCSRRRAAPHLKKSGSGPAPPPPPRSSGEGGSAARERRLVRSLDINEGSGQGYLCSTVLPAGRGMMDPRVCRKVGMKRNNTTKKGFINTTTRFASESFEREKKREKNKFDDSFEHFKFDSLGAKKN